jgi:hypothetical protein
LQDVMTQLVGVSPTVTFRKRRLSTVQDSEGSSGLLGSNSDHSAAREEQPVSTLTKQQQKTEALRTASWPRNPGLPGIPETVRRRRRDPREREAVVGLVLPLAVPQELQVQVPVDNEEGTWCLAVGHSAPTFTAHASLAPGIGPTQTMLCVRSSWSSGLFGTHCYLVLRWLYAQRGCCG